MVGRARVDAGRLELRAQLRLGVDADVAAFDERRVVLVGERPADPLGQPRGHGDRHGPAGPQHRGRARHGRAVVGDVLEHLGRDDPVEAGVGERQPRAIAVDAVAARASRPAARRHASRRTCAADVLELRRRVVERDHLRASPERLEGVPARAAPEVEDALARLQAEQVVVDGQHRLRPRLPRVRAPRSGRARAGCGTARRSSPRCAASSTGRRPAGDRARRRSPGARACRAPCGCRAASASLLPGSVSSAVSPSRPTTSGIAPPVVATIGAPQAIASMAGRENPSYSDGTTATSPRRTAR